MLNLVKLPELASGLMGGIASGGFVNATSLVSKSVGRDRDKQPKNSKKGGSVEKA